MRLIGLALLLFGSWEKVASAAPLTFAFEGRLSTPFMPWYGAETIWPSGIGFLQGEFTIGGPTVWGDFGIISSRLYLDGAEVTFGLTRHKAINVIEYLDNYFAPPELRVNYKDGVIIHLGASELLGGYSGPSDGIETQDPGLEEPDPIQNPDPGFGIYIRLSGPGSWFDSKPIHQDAADRLVSFITSQAWIDYYPFEGYTFDSNFAPFELTRFYLIPEPTAEYLATLGLIWLILFGKCNRWHTLYPISGRDIE